MLSGRTDKQQVAVMIP